MGLEVESLAVQGQRLVRSYLAAGIQEWTGETAAGVEGFSYAFGAYAAGSLWGKVRMAPGLSRGGDERRPYIIAHVLEGGGYGGTRDTGHKTKARGGKWTRGKTQHRKAIHEFRNATKVLKLRAAEVRADLTKDLNDGE
jgi:hypothetical protein